MKIVINNRVRAVIKELVALSDTYCEQTATLSNPDLGYSKALNTGADREDTKKQMLGYVYKLATVCRENPAQRRKHYARRGPRKKSESKQPTLVEQFGGAR